MTFLGEFQILLLEIPIPLVLVDQNSVPWAGLFSLSTLLYLFPDEIPGVWGLHVLFDHHVCSVF